MFDHLGIQTADVAASKAFYSSLLAPLGISAVMDYGVAVGFAGEDGKPEFWIGQLSDGAGREEIHVAFAAADRSVVEAFHAAAVGLGAEILHAPKEWPEYHDGYYGAFVRDLDGNNIEAVCHR